MGFPKKNPVQAMLGGVGADVGFGRVPSPNSIIEKSTHAGKTTYC